MKVRDEKRVSKKGEENERGFVKGKESERG